jgi:glyoxylase-like metal-dependent hydrolase (beta-lactamase superfamily II)
MNIRQISNRVFFSSPFEELDRPVIGMLKGSARTLFFDAGSSTNHVAEIKANAHICGIEEPDFIVISHSHTDHWFGLVNYNAVGICSQKCMGKIAEMMSMDWRKESYEKTIAEGKGSQFLANILNIEYGEDRAGIKLRKPEIAYGKTLIIDLGSMTAVIEEIESSHSPDETVLYIPEEKVLFLGDALYLRTNSKTDINSLFEQIEKYDAQYYIDSHHADVMSLQEAKEYCLSYMNSL